MRCLLDTHTFLWFIDDVDRLSGKAMDTLENGENEVFWSAVSFWEITVKLSLGKLRIKDNWRQSIEEEKRINRIRDLPLLEKHCVPNIDLPWHHRDPFDRLLISQAISEDLVLITKDANIKKYRLKTIW